MIVGIDPVSEQRKWRVKRARIVKRKINTVYFKRLIFFFAALAVCVVFLSLYLRSTRKFTENSQSLDMAARLKHLRVNPTGEHVGTVIFLHGLGDTGRGWLQAAQWLRLPGIRFILPHAPEIPITLNGGMRMPGWFDINQLDRLHDSQHDDEKGMMDSVASVEALIQGEIDAGIPANKIVVGGFSQGGAISLLLGLKTERKLAGVVALSTWVALNHKIKEIINPEAKNTPVFWGHGTDDQVVHYEHGLRSIELLKSLGFPTVKAGSAFARPGLRFESYPGLSHSSSTEELADLKAWLVEAFKDQA